MINLLTRSLPILLVLSVALVTRLYNLNWDSNTHLHPDERFLTMVTEAQRLPSSLAQYFDQSKSLLNPANINYKFYVYGVLPLTITKIVAVWAHMDSYNDITILGRLLSALIDTLLVLVVYGVARNLLKYTGIVSEIVTRHIALYTSFFYAIFVLPIQLSHFYATDTFSNTFFWISVYMATQTLVQKSKSHYIRLGYTALSGVFIAASVASKVSGLYGLPLVLVVLGIAIVIRRDVASTAQMLARPRASIYRLLSVGAVFALAFYFAIRVFNPYYFESPSLLDPTISLAFRQNIAQLEALTVPDGWFPPLTQFFSKPKYIFPFVNIVVFGVGLVPTLFGGIAIVSTCRRARGVVRQGLSRIFAKPQATVAILMTLVFGLWSIGIFVYLSSRVAYTLRYYVIYYPVIAFVAAYGLQLVVARVSASRVSSLTKSIVIGILVVATMTWTVMFMRIYMRDHSRVAASKYIIDTMPEGSLIASEHWDDGLPVGLANYRYKHFKHVELPVFGADTQQKWDEINKSLEAADYYILSSNRAWGSIMPFASRYPMQSAYYKKLFAGQTNYVHIATFSSYPGICLPGTTRCLEIPDQWSEEAFTVYDHPLVLIYKNKNK